MNNISLKQILWGGGLFIAFLALLVFNPFSRNDQGFRTVNQQLNGSEFIQFEPGWYYAGFFARTATYADVVTIQIEREDERKDDISYFSDPIRCQFSDGTYADRVGYSVKWRLPNNEASMLSIHKDYREQTRLAASLADYSKECANYSFQLMDKQYCPFT